MQNSSESPREDQKNPSEKPEESPQATPPSKSETDQLAPNYQELSAEVQAIKATLEKRKRENTTLKFLLYTGLIILFLGFIYSNTTLQRVQLKNQESSFTILQNELRYELSLAEKLIADEIERIKKRMSMVGIQERLLNFEMERLDQKEKLINETFARLKSVTAQLAPQTAENAQLIQALNRESEELMQAYHQYKKEVLSKTAARIVPDAGEQAAESSAEPAIKEEAEN